MGTREWTEDKFGCPAHKNGVVCMIDLPCNLHGIDTAEGGFLMYGNIYVKKITHFERTENFVQRWLRHWGRSRKDPIAARADQIYREDNEWPTRSS